MALTHRQIRDRYATMRNFMVGDCARSLRDANANYLVAMGLLTYVEALGGLITGKGGIPRGQSASNFNAALQQMPADYANFHVHISRPGLEPGHGPYQILRCGMVHQYAPAEDFIVWANSSRRAQSQRIGFEWEALPGGGQRLAINTNELLRDFRRLAKKITGWISARHPQCYPNIKRAMERIDSFTVSP